MRVYKCYIVKFFLICEVKCYYLKYINCCLFGKLVKYFLVEMSLIWNEVERKKYVNKVCR